MEVAIRMNMVQTTNNLVKATCNQARSEWPSLSRLCELIEVALHALKDKVELARSRGNERVVEGNHCWVWWNCS